MLYKKAQAEDLKHSLEKYSLNTDMLIAAWLYSYHTWQHHVQVETRGTWELPLSTLHGSVLPEQESVHHYHPAQTLL